MVHLTRHGGGYQHRHSSLSPDEVKQLRSEGYEVTDCSFEDPYDGWVEMGYLIEQNGVLYIVDFRTDDKNNNNDNQTEIYTTV